MVNPVTLLSAVSETVKSAASVMDNPASLLIIMVVVVFLVLALLILLVWLVGRIFVAADKKKAGKTAETPAVAPAVTAAPAPEVEDGISEETVAVISATIAAYQAETGTVGRITSVKTAAPAKAPAKASSAPIRRTRTGWAQAAVIRSTTPFGD